MGRKAGKPDFGHPPRDYGYSIIQNLKDAGCTDELIEEFRTLEEQAEEERQLQLLSGHRKHLLEELHKEEKRIDCLDYLIYQIEYRKQKGGFFG